MIGIIPKTSLDLLKVNKMKDYRFIALTFLIGMVVGSTIMNLNPISITIGIIMFIIWGISLFQYMGGK